MVSFPISIFQNIEIMMFMIRLFFPNEVYLIFIG